MSGQRERFRDQIVVVTGGSAGIGRAVVECFAREGAIVIVNGSRADRVNQVVEDVVAQGGQAFGITGDVSDRGAVERNVADVMDRYGRIDILINNAGVNSVGAAESYPDFGKVLGVNLFGPLYWSQLAATHSMIPRRRGAIVNVSSLAGVLAIGNDVGYVASKAGLIGLTRALSLEWAKHGIRVNCVAPGLAESDMMRQFEIEAPDQYSKFVANIPMARLSSGAEQAKVMLFLASDEASYLTGVIVNVDGGLHNVI